MKQNRAMRLLLPVLTAAITSGMLIFPAQAQTATTPTGQNVASSKPPDFSKLKANLNFGTSIANPAFTINTKVSATKLTKDVTSVNVICIPFSLSKQKWDVFDAGLSPLLTVKDTPSGRQFIGDTKIILPLTSSANVGNIFCKLRIISKKLGASYVTDFDAKKPSGYWHMTKNNSYYGGVFVPFK